MTTGIIEYQNNKPRFGFIRDGVAGSYDIVWRMIDIVRNSVLLDKGFEDFVKQTVATNGFDSYSNTDTLFEFLYNFFKYGKDGFDGIDYLQDIRGASESIKDARTTLQDEYGDCDDCAILTATALAVLGYSPLFVIAKYPDEDAFQHVYTVAYVNDKRYVFDLTIQDGHLNSEVENMQKEEIGIFEQRAETDGIKGVIRNIKYLVKETQANAREAAPFLSSFLPVGLLGQTVARNLLGSATAEQSLNALGSEITGEITDAIIKLQNGLMTKEIALAIARKRYSQLFSIDRTQVDADTFNAIENKINRKIDYINSFVLYGTPQSVEPLLNTNKLLLYGVLGVGAYYVIKQHIK